MSAMQIVAGLVLLLGGAILLVRWLTWSLKLATYERSQRDEYTGHYQDGGEA